MRFPIDTSGLRFVVAAAEPLRGCEDGWPREAWPLRTSEDGQVLWCVPLVALGDGAGDVLRVTVPGDPGVEPGATVAVEEMIALTWRLDGRAGVSLRARAIKARADLTAVKAG